MIYLPATLQLRPHGSPIHCLARDHSIEGAHLLLEDDIALPQRFLISIGSEQPPVRYASILWRRGQELGVAYDRDNDG
jgi:hypothetical protein